MSFLFIDDAVDFPTAIASDAVASSSTSAVTFSDTPVTGDLLLAFITVYATAARTVTPPAGWATLYNEVGAGNLRRACAFWKISDGTETAPSFTLDTASASAGALRRYRGATSAEAGAATSGTSSGPATFAALAPSWPPTKTRWVGVVHAANPSPTISTPSSYTGGAGYGAGVTNAIIASFDRNLEDTSSEAPGNSTLSTSCNWRTRVIGLQPS